MSKKLENKDIDKNIIKIIDEIKVKFKKGYLSSWSKSISSGISPVFSDILWRIIYYYFWDYQDRAGEMLKEKLKINHMVMWRYILEYVVIQSKF